ncbi:MAG: hypothetical protein ABIG84_04460 [archaeon]
MTNLSKDVLRTEIINDKLVVDYEDLDVQLTANGIDFRVAAIIEVKKAGELRINKKDMKMPVLGVAHVMEGFEDVVSGLELEDTVVLPKGSQVSIDKLVPYLVVSCEKVNTKENLNFKIECRSSLFRITQSVLETAFGEAGYRGGLTFLMFSLLDTKIDLGVRFAQIVFSTLSGNAHYEEQKESSYQGGKVL